MASSDRECSWLAAAVLLCACSGSKPQGAPSPCAMYGDPETATVHGTGFDAWEQEPVGACFYPAQFFQGPACGRAIVTNGQFSITLSVCTGVMWTTEVGSAPRIIGCPGGEITPASCWCSSGNGPDPGDYGQPGQGCDGGLP